MTAISEIAKEMKTKFYELGAEVPLADLEKELSKYIRDYKTREEDARKVVFKRFCDRYGVAAANAGLTKIATIDKKGVWLSLKVKVVQIWENRSESILQAGLIGDDTGVIKFTSFAKSNLPLLAEGKVYQLSNLVTDEYPVGSGKFSVKMNKTTKIEEATEDIEVKRTEIEKQGLVIDVSALRSGIVKRCSECKKIVKGSECDEHKTAKVNPDIRCVAILDNGQEALDIVLNAEMVAKMFSVDGKPLTMDLAKEIIVDSMDPKTIVAIMTKQIVGKRFVVRGYTFSDSDFFIVTDMQMAENKIDLEELGKIVEAL